MPAKLCGSQVRAQGPRRVDLGQSATVRHALDVHSMMRRVTSNVDHLPAQSVYVCPDRFRSDLWAAAGFLLGCGAGVLGSGAAIALGFGRSISAITLEDIAAIVAGLTLTAAVTLRVIRWRAPKLEDSGRRTPFSPSSGG